MALVSVKVGILTFETDVTVQCGSNSCAEHRKNVSSGRNTVRRNSKIGWVRNILGLVSVHKEAVEHVTGNKKEKD